MFIYFAQELQEKRRATISPLSPHQTEDNFNNLHQELQQRQETIPIRAQQFVPQSITLPHSHAYPHSHSPDPRYTEPPLTKPTSHHHHHHYHQSPSPPRQSQHTSSDVSTATTKMASHNRRSTKFRQIQRKIQQQQQPPLHLPEPEDNEQHPVKVDYLMPEVEKQIQEREKVNPTPNKTPTPPPLPPPLTPTPTPALQLCEGPRTQHPKT